MGTKELEPRPVLRRPYDVFEIDGQEVLATRRWDPAPTASVSKLRLGIEA